jgi:hypothetical protein
MTRDGPPACVLGVGLTTSHCKNLACYGMCQREYNGTVHQLFIDFKEAYDSVKREILYDILLEFCVPKKLFSLMKLCLNETYSKICIGKHLSDTFHIQNGLKQGDALLPLVFNFGLEYAIRKVQENKSIWK